MILQIRAASNPPLNEYAPKTVEKLNWYISRNNYEKPPALYPRMWNPYYAEAYMDWIETKKQDADVNSELAWSGTFKQNVDYFFNYQLGYMYVRYLMWNFVGKTNDLQGFGDADNGQWNSGIETIDKIFGINPESFPENTLRRGNTVYYFVPLLLVIIGFFYHFIKDRKGFWINLAMWFMTSVAVVIYLNMTPYQARERDYVFLTSFLALVIWLTIGTLAISQWIVNLMLLHRPRFVLPVFFIIPLWLLSQNYISHNHSKQYTARNFAMSFLESCQPQAILLTNGDNDTFPLWYLQNVENIRTDVRVINLAFLNSPDFIEQLKTKVYNSNPLKISTLKSDYFDKSLNLSAAARNLIGDKPSQIARTLNDEVISTDNVYTLGMLMLMDVITSNIRQRPIYFSAYSNEEFLGLDNFLLLEGFAYRLDSVKVANVSSQLLPPKYGSVDARKMYEHFNRFSWKGFRRNATYYNELERSVIEFYAQNATFLAYSLYQKKEYEKAYNVLEQCTSYLPVSIHEYPNPLAYIAIMYDLLDGKVKAEDNLEKANHYLFHTLDYYKRYMHYYFSLNDDLKAHKRWEAQKIMTNWLYLCYFTDNEKLDDLRLSLAEGFWGVASNFLTISYKHLETMQKNPEFYYKEIEKTTVLIKDILALGKDYEEKLPQPSKSLF
jgi:hypothetical protein